MADTVPEITYSINTPSPSASLEALAPQVSEAESAEKMVLAEAELALAVRELHNLQASNDPR